MNHKFEHRRSAGETEESVHAKAVERGLKALGVTAKAADGTPDTGVLALAVVDILADLHHVLTEACVNHYKNGGCDCHVKPLEEARREHPTISEDQLLKLIAADDVKSKYNRAFEAANLIHAAELAGMDYEDAARRRNDMVKASGKAAMDVIAGTAKAMSEAKPDPGHHGKPEIELPPGAFDNGGPFPYPK